MQASIDYIGVGTGGVLINEKGEVLFLKRKKAPEVGCWSIPGGAIEYGETARGAIIREFQEETGIEGDIIHFLGYGDYILLSERRHWISLFFIVTNKEKKEPVNKEPSKHSEMRWFDLENLPDNLTGNTVRAITLYKEWIKKVRQA